MVEWNRVGYREGYVEYQAAVGSFWLIISEYGGNFSGRIVNSSNSIVIAADIKRNLEDAKAEVIRVAKEAFAEALSVLGG